MRQRDRYRDRREAGRVLADYLGEYREHDVLVLAVPRGGVPVALPVVNSLKAELDLIIPRKIGAPMQPEQAIGAVCEDGEVLLNPHLVRSLGVSDDYINSMAEKEVKEIKRRLSIYREDKPPAKVSGRSVIVIDDGVATGFTITAALQSVARRNPSELILALPVGPSDTIAMLSREVSRVICPLQAENFYAVGQFYDDFSQIDDEEVKMLLAEAWGNI